MFLVHLRRTPENELPKCARIPLPRQREFSGAEGIEPPSLVFVQSLFPLSYAPEYRCIIPDMLKRKTSLRDAYAARQREKYKAKAKDIVAQKPGRHTPLKKQSKALRRRYALYLELRAAFLARPENWECAICLARRAAGEDVRIKPASEVHHSRSRNGRLLIWEPGFVASCRDDRVWPHANPKRAREMGLLSSAAEWGVYPR